MFVLFHPFGLAYNFFNIDNLFGRKEYLILNLLIYIINKEKFSTKKDFTLFFSLLFLIILIYEPILFFFPLIFFLYKLKKEVKLNYLRNNLFIFSFINILMFTTFKGSKNFSALCESINSLNSKLDLNEKNCWGAPRYLSNQDYKSWLIEVYQNLLLEDFGLIWAILFFILILTIFLFSNLDMRLFKLYLKNTASLFLLFIVAIDYGRWLNLIFFTVILIYFANIKYSQIYPQKNHFFLYSLIPIFNIFINVPLYLNQNIDYFKLNYFDLKTIFTTTIFNIWLEFLLSINYLKNLI